MVINFFKYKINKRIQILKQNKLHMLKFLNGFLPECGLHLSHVTYCDVDVEYSDMDSVG